MATSYLTYLPRLTRSNAKSIFPTVLAVALTIANAPYGNAILTYLLIVVFTALSLGFSRSTPALAEGQPSEQADAVLLPTVAVRELPALEPTSTSGRLAYLDTLKACLTLVVILHHVLGAFAGTGSLGLSVGDFRNALQPILSTVQVLNQSYFMSLFFFISAYFAPSSVARKGARGFLRDRCTKLGAPFAVFLLLLGPLCVLVLLAAKQEPLAYVNYTGPLWFVVYLGLFSYAYACVAEDGGAQAYLVQPLPSPLTLAGAGLALGLAQGLQLLFFPLFPLMPITFASLPLDLAAYCAGILARRNGWLAQPLPPSLVLPARAYSLAFALALAALYATLYSAGGGYFLLSTNACGSPADRGSSSPLGTAIPLLLALCTASGGFTVSMSITALDLFRGLGQQQQQPSRLMAFLSANAYAAYLLHPLVVFPATWGFVAAVRGTGRAVSWEAGASDSASCLSSSGSGQEGVLVAGLAAVATVAVLGTYALAAAVRLIPGTERYL